MRRGDYSPNIWEMNFRRTIWERRFPRILFPKLIHLTKIIPKKKAEGSNPKRQVLPKILG